MDLIDTAKAAANRRRPRGKNKKPLVAGWHGIEAEAHDIGRDPASLRRLIRQGRYPRPAIVAGHQMYPDNHSAQFAAEQFAHRNASKI